MTARRQKARTLFDVEAVLAARKAAQERVVAHIRNELDELEGQCDVEVQHLTEIENGWTLAIGGQSLRITEATVWSAEWRLRTETLKGLDERRRAACFRLDDEIGKQATLTAREEAVADMKRDALRQIGRFEDEQRLNEYRHGNFRGWRAE